MRGNEGDGELMRDRLIELLRQRSCYYVDCSGRSCVGCQNVFIQDNDIERIADHLLENGVIVPPYRCGTVVYVVRSQTSNGKNLYMRKERIDHYRMFNNGTFMIFESGRCSVRNDQWSRCVFVTPEEAEQALKGGESND